MICPITRLTSWYGKLNNTYSATHYGIQLNTDIIHKASMGTVGLASIVFKQI